LGTRPGILKLKAKSPMRVVITFVFLLLVGSAGLARAQTVSVWLTTDDQSKTLAATEYGSILGWQRWDQLRFGG